MIENHCPNCPQNAQTGNCVGLDDKRIIALDDLKAQIKHVLSILYERDYDLLERQVDERSISHKFAHYYEVDFADQYAKHDFDAEYQRNGIVPKYYSYIKYAIPDFIIHRRNCNKHNLVMFEFKPFWSKSKCHRNDINKLRAFTSNEELFIKDGKPWYYSYSYGIHIILRCDVASIAFYKHGEAEPFSTNNFEFQGAKHYE